MSRTRHYMSYYIQRLLPLLSDLPIILAATLFRRESHYCNSHPGLWRRVDSGRRPVKHAFSLEYRVKLPHYHKADGRSFALASRLYIGATGHRLSSCSWLTLEIAGGEARALRRFFQSYARFYRFIICAQIVRWRRSSSPRDARRRRASSGQSDIVAGVSCFIFQFPHYYSSRAKAQKQPVLDMGIRVYIFWRVSIRSVILFRLPFRQLLSMPLYWERWDWCARQLEIENYGRLCII